MSLTPQVPLSVKQAQMTHPAMGAPQPWGSANGKETLDHRVLNTLKCRFPLFLGCQGTTGGGKVFKIF